MKVFPAIAVMITFGIASFFFDGSFAHVLQERDNFCYGYETSCRFGCCPIANGTCCSDGLQCCRQGETCVPGAHVCLVPKRDSNVLALGETTPVTLPAKADKAAVPCPPCTTTCGEDKCCFTRDGTCCADGLHCCPWHYDCDIPNEICYRNDHNEVMNHMDGSNHTAVTKLLRALDKLPYEECPGSELLYCPSYTKCCRDNNDQWTCCLKKLSIEIEEGIC